MPQEKIVFWIPIDKDCNVVFDRIKSADKIKLISNEREEETGRELPIIKFVGTIHQVKSIELIKTEPNPKYCYWIVQEGVLKEK